MASVYHAAILKASEDQGTLWPLVAERLLPGAHAILMGDAPTWPRSSVNARRAGLEVRDSVGVLASDGLSFAVILRKPLETTVAEQLMKTGTGALNIDGTRVFTDWNEADRPDSWKRSGHSAKPDADKIAAPPGTGINCHPKGRWPSNLVFIHGEGCVLDGVRSFKPTNGSGRAVERNRSGTKGNIVYGVMNATTREENQGYVDESGAEAVPNWICAPGCAVAALDKQSGDRKSTGPHPSSVRSASTYRPNQGAYQKQGPLYADFGGASRFYKQFKDRGELIAYFITLILPENGALLAEFPS